MCTNGLEDYIDELVECFEDFIKKSLLMISVTLGTIVLMVMYVLKLLSDRPHPALTSRDYDDEYDEVPNRRRSSVVEFQSEDVSFNRPPAIQTKRYKDQEVNTQESYGTLVIQSATNSDQTQAETDNSFVNDGVYGSKDDDKNKNRIDGKDDRKGAKNDDKNDDKNKNRNITTNNNVTSKPGQLECSPSCADKIILEDGTSSCSQPCHEDYKRARLRNDPAPGCISKHHLSNSRPCKRYIAIRSSCCSMCCADDDRR